MSKTMARTLGSGGQSCVRRVSSSRIASHSTSITTQSNADFVPQSAIDASGAGRMIMHKPEIICGTAVWIILQIAYDALQYRVILSTVH